MKHITTAFLALVLLFSGCCRCANSTVMESCRCGENTETTDTASTATVPVSDAKAPREITYSVEKILEEEVTDHEFNRNIRIFEIHTNSANRDKIEQYITYFPYSWYFQYINYGVPYEWQNLGMDAEIHEVDGILCAGALGHLCGRYLAEPGGGARPQESGGVCNGAWFHALSYVDTRQKHEYPGGYRRG